MKRISGLLLSLVLLMAVLAGCGEKSVDPYGAIKNAYLELQSNGFDLEGTDCYEYDENGISEGIIDSYMLDYMRYLEKPQVFFSETDIDGNGICELIIGGGESPDDVKIFDVFSMHGEEAVRLIPDIMVGERSELIIYEGGLLQYDGSGGATTHTYDFFRMNESGYSVSLAADMDYYPENYDDFYNISYFVDGQKVTEKAFHTRLNELEANKKIELTWSEE